MKLSHVSYVTNPTNTIVLIHICFTLFNASKEPQLLPSLFKDLIDVLNRVIFGAVYFAVNVFLQNKILRFSESKLYAVNLNFMWR